MSTEERKSKIEFTAKITEPDGTIIEKTITKYSSLPSTEDFDLSTKEGFLDDFDVLEKAIVESRNEIGKGIAEEYMNTASKKTSKKKRRENKGN